MTPPTKPIPLSEEKLAYWRTEIKNSRAKRTRVASDNDWDGNLKRYEPPHRRPTDGTWPHDGINLGVDFADVERKKAALLFDTPTVALTTTIPGRESAVMLHQELLNALLGPQHANVKPTALKAIFNCLCPAGIGPVIVGYDCTTQTIDVDVPLPPDPLDPMAPPQTQKMSVPVPIAEKWFVSGLSAKAILLPAELRDTDYQKAAAWIGYEWRKPVSQVRREHGLAKDWSPKGGEAERPYFRANDSDGEDEATGDPAVSGVTLWYHTYLDAKAGQTVHPDRLRELVLADGDDTPLVHKDSPHQTLITDGPDAGRLSPDSLLGFQLRPLVLRDLSDSAWVPSDCSVTAGLTREQSKYRSIALRKRDENRLVMLYDPAKLNKDARDKVEDGTQSRIPVEPGMLAQGVEGVMAQIGQLSQGRETYLDQELIANDRAKILGMDANQVGSKTPGKRTATESTIVQRNTEARFEQERTRVLEWFLDVVRAFDCLVVRYADQRIATQILGPERGQVWVQAKTQGLLSGAYTYTIQMDSSKYVDVEADRDFWMKVYNATGQDPNVRRTETLKKIAPKLGMDPNTWIIEQLPEKPPEPPKVSITISAENFNPQLPQFPIVIEVARLGGWKISAEAIQAAQTQASAAGTLLAGVPIPVAGASADPKQPQPPPAHGGPQPPGELINKHEQDRTGQRPGPQVM